jgi:hypothetical protein
VDYRVIRCPIGQVLERQASGMASYGSLKGEWIVVPINFQIACWLPRTTGAPRQKGDPGQGGL